MNKNYYSPMCRRTDGSIYIDKNRFWKDFFGGAAAALLLTALFTAIALFTFVDPFGIEAERHENPTRSSEIVADRSAPVLRNAR